MDNRFQYYRRTTISEARPFEPGEVLDLAVSISKADRAAGSPKTGDMIGRDPKNHSDQWLINGTYFASNFELVEPKANAAG